MTKSPKTKRQCPRCGKFSGVSNGHHVLANGKQGKRRLRCSDPSCRKNWTEGGATPPTELNRRVAIVPCPYCGSKHTVSRGVNATGKSRRWCNDCARFSAVGSIGKGGDRRSEAFQKTRDNARLMKDMKLKVKKEENTKPDDAQLSGGVSKSRTTAKEQADGSKADGSI